MAKGIYKITNDRTGETYVGQAVNIDSRKNRHFRELAQGKHHNQGIQKDHDRGDTFTFEVLEEMPDATKADLKNRESHYVSKFNSFREGYNQTPGGAMDQFKGKYEYGGGRLPKEKYKLTKKYVRSIYDCPVCGGNLTKKNGSYGEFVGCDNFPECEFTCSLSELEQLKTEVVPYSIQNKINKLKYKKEFEKFNSKKQHYLTKADCEYLSKEYEIDISNSNTVKEKNPIIKNYLKENKQWDLAIKNLFQHYHGHEYEIESCSERSINKEPVNVVNDNITHNKKDEESNNINKNYCSNCGHETGLGDIYCENCGEKINGISSGFENKGDTGSRGDTFATIVLVIIIIIFVFSLIIITSGQDGPISTVAAVVFVAIACFFCAAGSD